MGRGVASKGKRPTGGPDWLGPNLDGDAGGGGGGGASYVEEEPKKRKKKRDIDDELDEPPKKGIQWKPLAFLIMMTLPAAAPMLLSLIDHLQVMGIPMPGQGIFAPNPYRPCLQDFYADYAPEKLGNLDKTLEEFKGREKQLFGRLSKKYGKKAEFARCVPKKSS